MKYYVATQEGLPHMGGKLTCSDENDASSSVTPRVHKVGDLISSNLTSVSFHNGD